MKILCYGDSNTWGFSPIDGSRFSEDIRWPAVMGRCLGEPHTVIEDGLNGRTLCTFATEGDPLNGAEHLPSVIHAYKRPELVILYLGINDLFVDPQISVPVMAGRLERVIEQISQAAPSTSLLVMSPFPVYIDEEYHGMYHRQIENSLLLTPAMQEIADKLRCGFLDTSQIITASRRDGVHIEAEEHIKLGLHLCVQVRELTVRTNELHIGRE